MEICELVNDVIVMMTLTFQNNMSKTMYMILRWKNPSSAYSNWS